jgi:CheY-like chemotaxis protein
MKILVVEDNAMIAMDHEMLIQDLGHDCVGIAANSAKALEVARSEAPDVALVDLGLADGWTGPPLVEELHRMGIASIVVSGQVEDYQAPEHVLSVLAKPLRIDLLAAALRKHATSSAR